MNEHAACYSNKTISKFVYVFATLFTQMRWWSWASWGWLFRGFASMITLWGLGMEAFCLRIREDSLLLQPGISIATANHLKLSWYSSAHAGIWDLNSKSKKNIYIVHKRIHYASFLRFTAPHHIGEWSQWCTQFYIISDWHHSQMTTLALKLLEANHPLPLILKWNFFKSQ